MLVYDEAPRERATKHSASARSRAAEETGLSLRAFVALLRQRWLWIIGLGLAGAAVAFLTGKSLPPRYTAVTQVYLDPRDLRLTDKELTPVNQDSNGFLPIVESQAQVIASSNVLGRVVKSLGLADDPEFVKESVGGLVSRIGAALGLSEAPPAPDENSAAAAALVTLEKRVGIRRTGRSFIVDVSVWAGKADKAARIANAIVAAYLDEEAATRSAAATRATTGLTARLSELREAVNQAENRVQAYKAEKGLVGVRDQLVTDQQLIQVNTQLAAARVRAADAQARFEQLQRMRSIGADPGANEDALASQAIAAMRTQYAELSRKQAELLHDLGPRHPLVTSINSQVQQSRRLIDQEIGRYVQAAKTDLARAQSTVATLERSFDQAKAKTVGQQQAMIRLRELERDMEASKVLYESFLARARETGQQASLNNANARVISPAVKPQHRSYPPPARILALLGFIVGLLLGIALAIGDDRLRREMRRERGDDPAPNPGPAPASVDFGRHATFGSGIAPPRAIVGGKR